MAESWLPVSGHGRLPTAESRTVWGPQAALPQLTVGTCGIGGMGSCVPSPVRGPDHHTVKISLWQPQRPQKGAGGVPMLGGLLGTTQSLVGGSRPCLWMGRQGHRGTVPWAGSWGPVGRVWNLRVASSGEKSWPFLFGGGCQGSSGYASWGICSLCLGPVTMAAPVCFHVTMCYILNKFLTALYQVLIEDYCYLDKDSCTLPLPKDR